MRKINDFSRDEIYNIAMYYAKNDVSRSYFCEKYDISSSTFYSILRKAIIEHIVDMDTVFLIRNRSTQNALKHYKAKHDSHNLNYYLSLLDKGNLFLFTRKKRVDIVKEFFARDTDTSKRMFCRKKHIDIELLDKLIIHTIIYSEISNKLFDSIKCRDIAYFNYSQNVIEFYANLERIREEIKEYSVTYDLNNLYLELLTEFKKDKNMNTKDNTSSSLIDEYSNLIITDFDVIDEA